MKCKNCQFVFQLTTVKPKYFDFYAISTYLYWLHLWTLFSLTAFSILVFSPNQTCFIMFTKPLK